MQLQNIHNFRRDVYIYERDEQGYLNIKKDDTFFPYYFEKDINGKFNSYDGNRLKKIFCSLPSDVAKQRSLESYESDILFNKRYLLDKIQRIDKGSTKYFFIDIEILTKEFPDPKKAEKPISCITIYNSFDKEYKVWFLDEWNKDEEEMLSDFVSYIKEEKPDLILGWNMINFDYMYLHNRINDFSNKISPVNLSRHSGQRDGDIFFPNGISILDYMTMFKKVYMREPSYALDQVAQKHLKEKPWKDTDFSTLGKIVKEKNINDVKRLVKLEENFNLISYYDEIRRFTMCLWEDVLFNSKILDMFILREARKRNIILPMKPKSDNYGQREDLQGAYRRADTGVFYNVYKADVGCVDEKTEILTNNGWKKYNTILNTDKVLSLDIKNNNLKYKKIKRIYKYKYHGDVINIKSKNTDQILSLDHRVLFRKRQRNKKPYFWKEYEFELAEKLSYYCQLPTSGIFNGNYKKISDDYLKLCAWIITEGHLHKYRSISIYQSSKNMKYVLEISSLLKKLKLNYKRHSRRRKNSKEREFEFRIKSEDGKYILSKYLSKNKEIPENLLNLNIKQSRLFLDTLIKGDDSFYKDCCVFVTNNIKLAEQVCELSLKCNYRSSIRKQIDKRLKKNKEIYYVNISKKNNHCTLNRNNIKKIKYKGILWCIENSNKTIVCKRNGKIFITGNSMYPNQIINFCLDIKNLKQEKNDNTLLINGNYFEQNEDALLPSIAKRLIDQKDETKQELKELKPETKEYDYVKTRYDAIKALVNSLYGATALPVFRLYNYEIASSITYLSRDLLSYVEEQMKEMGYRVYYLDTDSLMYQAEQDETELLNKLVIDWSITKFNKPDIDISFDGEGKFTKILILGRCHYFGYLETPKGVIKEIKGMEIKRSSSSKYEASYQEDLINKILERKSKDQIIEWIKEKKKQINSIPLIDLAFPCKISDRKYKNEPIFVRAYNNSKTFDKDFRVENNTRFYYLFVKGLGKDKNGKNVDVLGLSDTNQFNDLKHYIDWDSIIQRSIMTKTSNIFKALNWGDIQLLLSNQTTLDDF